MAGVVSVAPVSVWTAACALCHAANSWATVVDPRTETRQTGNLPAEASDIALDTSSATQYVLELECAGSLNLRAMPMAAITHSSRTYEYERPHHCNEHRIDGGTIQSVYVMCGKHAKL